MLTTTPIKSEKAVNDLLALAELITKPDVFKKNVTELQALQAETNKALDKLTKGKSIDEMLKKAKDADRLAKAHIQKAEKEADKLINNAKQKAQDQLQAANSHSKSVLHQHDALLAEAKAKDAKAQELLETAQAELKEAQTQKDKANKMFSEANAMKLEYWEKVNRLKGSLSELI